MPFSPIQRSGLGFYPTAKFNDKRLSRRYDRLLAQMSDHQSCVVHQISSDESESRGYYRFLANERVSHSEMLEHTCTISPSLIASRRLVVLGDSSEFSLKSCINHIKDADRIGVLSDNKTPGYLAHAHLVLDAQHGGVLGLSDLMLWNRPSSSSSSYERKRSVKTRSWEEKESYKWWMGISHSQSVLSSAKEILFVFDSEADISTLWEKPLEDKTDMLIRVQHNDRQLADRSMNMYEYLDKVEFCGQYSLDVQALDRWNYSKNKAQSRQGRETEIQFRYSSCELKMRKRKATITKLYLIEALEKPDLVPEGEDPIHWYLLSTRPIDSAEQARELIRIYEWRWQIEQLFRLMKRKGFAVEQTELTSLDAILRQTILSFGAAIRVMQLLRARDQVDGQSIEVAFFEKEQKCLQALNRKFQGNTQKQKNPFPKDQLAWASWIIARLGGWKGYKTQHPPGPITFKRGWEKFNIYFDAWNLFDP